MTDSRSDPTIVQRLMQALEADTAVELARALGLPVTAVAPCASRWWSPVPCPPASCWKTCTTMWT